MTTLEPPSSLASTAALILATASPLDTTFLPLTWPQDFGAACNHPSCIKNNLQRAHEEQVSWTSAPTAFLGNATDTG